MRDLTLLARPGEAWSYNNAGFGVAGRAIEVVTGKSIDDALAELVFTPLGLSHAFTRLGDVVTRRFAVGHRDQDAKAAVIPSFTLPANVTAGGIAMSLNDLLNYGKFHLSDGGQILTRASLQQMRTARLQKQGTDDEMGIGWHLRKVGGVTTAAHGGTLGGHCLLLELVPERNLVLSILTNHSSGWRLIQDVERAALKLLEGVSLDPKQAIGHRGVNETMPDAPLLTAQPSASQYVGLYRRPPSGDVQVREENGRLMIGETVLAFYAPDRAVATTGNNRGNPYEFLRKEDGTVGWIRVVGRIARKN
jgi:CubicO group peptidase (beta-lactamase class C family)